MAAEVKKEIELEIAHVLFLDIVGYSKLSVNEQHAQVEQLNEIVRLSEQFRKAEAAGRLLKIPTGDGMALVFYKSPEEPAQCAVEISRALKEHPRLQIRMGIHSGPVSGVVDVAERTNVAGVGINIARRVMDCGDAGHILLSKHVAEDLEHYERWRPFLHDLGSCEVKHGVRLEINNLHSDEIGNLKLPSKLQAVRKHRAHVRWAEIGAALLLLGAIIAGVFFFERRQTTSGLPVLDKSIAVLPFENLSSDKENAYLTDGVQNEILTDLAKIADLKVISHTSVMLYKAGNPRNLREIGQQLGVAHILEGSVQRAAGKVRVNAQLIDARTDKHLWAKTYDRDVADVFAMESELAQLIANELQAKISPSEKVSIEEQPTQDLATYDFYVGATPLVEQIALSSTKEKDLSTAVDLLNQAVTRDPSFLLAYCRLANAHDQFYFQGVDRTPARLALAQSAIDSAFRLKPDSGEAHLALATHLYYGYFDYVRARAELDIARRTLPNNPQVYEVTAWIDRRQGRWSDAVRDMERASELDPRNFFLAANVAVLYFGSRPLPYEPTRKALDRALALKPNDIDARIDANGGLEMHWRADTRHWHATIEKILADEPASANDQAMKLQRFQLALFERDFIAAGRIVAAAPQEQEWLNGFSRDFWIGVVARAKGDLVAAQSAFTAARATQAARVRAQPDVAPELSMLGLIDAGLGRKEEALHEGRQAVELMPIAKDSTDGPLVAYNLAWIYAWTGEPDLASEQLEIVSKIPNGPTYGELRLDPVWDPLRGDPRFEKIVVSLAPKEASK